MTDAVALIKVIPPPLYRYGIAILAVLAGFLLRNLLEPFFDQRPTLPVFLLSVAIAARFGGMRGGLLATLLSVLVSGYFFMPPFHSFEMAETSDRILTLLFIVIGTVISFLSEGLHAARWQAEKSAREAVGKQKRLEREVSERLEAKRKLSLFFSLVPDMLCIAGFDGYFKRLNAGWGRTLGFSDAELMAEPFINFVHPDDRERTLAEAARLEDGVMTYGFENRYRCKDGSYKWLQWNSAPFQGLMYATARDITEHKEAEKERAENAAYERTHGQALSLFNESYDPKQVLDGILALLAENHAYSASGIYLYDEWTGRFHCQVCRGISERGKESFRRGEGPAGEAAELNQSRLVTGLDEATALALGFDELASRSPSVIISPIVYKEHCLGVLVAARDRNINERDRRFLDRLCLSVGVALHNLQQYSDLQALAEQLRLRSEEIARKNEQLMEANRLKSEFLANMSHELRTPLNAIIGFSEILKDGLLGELNPKQREYVTDIFDSGQHLLSLINDILDLSKIEAGKMMLECETMNVPLLLKNSLSIIRERALARDIQLDCELAEGMEDVQADSRKCKQILYNLLSNAVKFTPEGGRIRVCARKVAGDAVRKKNPESRLAAASWDDFLEISVSDTGIGIAEADQKRLFEPFVQLDGSLSRQYEGTGLGLALVSRLTELHGGVVAVQSEKGQGSCFTVWLPYRAAEAANDATSRADLGPAPAAPASPREDQPARLALVIEDDDHAAELIRLQLEAEGMRVARVRTGEEGLEFAARQMPDLITLDILLPGMDGWELISRLQGHPILAHVPVVIISVVAETRKGFSLGAAAVLQKPFYREELHAALATLGFASGPDQPVRVLVADDDPKAVEIVSEYLQHEHYRVLRAYGGQEAIDMARRERPDLIVLDLMMPIVSGFDVVEALKHEPETAWIPILILTAKVITAKDREILNGHILKIVEKAQFNEGRFIGEVRRAIRAFKKHNGR